MIGTIQHIAYEVFLYLVTFFASIVALVSPKLRAGFVGRKKTFAALAQFRSQPNIPTVLLHCASHGEYEQVKPIINRFLQAKFKTQLVLTFFSPSGYGVAKKDGLTKHIYYLPWDKSKEVNKFLDHIKPDVAIWVKYDLWPNILNALFQRKIPTYLISARLKKEHWVFGKFGSVIRGLLKQFTQIHCENKVTFDQLEAFGLSNVFMSGDTRIDRIIDIAGQPDRLEWVPQKLNRKPILILGSIWPSDWIVIKEALGFIRSHYHIIAAPHEINSKFLEQIKLALPKAQLLSAYNRELSMDHLIIDTIGDLAHLYRYANVAYIGGAFGEGLHNTLEPAAYGIPIIYGPQIDSFYEAKDLIEIKAGHTIGDHLELEKKLKQISLVNVDNDTHTILKAYIAQSKGATDIIWKALELELNYVSKR